MREGGEGGYFWCKRGIGRTLLSYFRFSRKKFRLERLVGAFIGPGLNASNIRISWP